MNIKNINHVTLIVGHPQKAIDFYEGVLGFKLIKKTLDYTDKDNYMLYFSLANQSKDIFKVISYSDEKQGRSGAREIESIMLKVANIDDFEEKLRSFDISTYRIEKFNQIYLKFKDPFGIDFEMINDSDSVDQNEIKGIFGYVINTDKPSLSIETVKKLFDAKEVNKNYQYNRYKVADYFIDINHTESKQEKAILGIGRIRDIAFNVENIDEISSELKTKEFHPSIIRDLKYYKMVSFKDKGGINYAITTKSDYYIDEDVLGINLIVPELFKEFKKEIIDKMMPLFSGKNIERIKNYGYIDLPSYTKLEEHNNMLKRLNELAAKNKTNGLTELEFEERDTLRKKYAKSVTSGFRNLVEGVRVIDPEDNEVTFVKRSNKE